LISLRLGVSVVKKDDDDDEEYDNEYEDENDVEAAHPACSFLLSPCSSIPFSD
jgi:hypothetical protein